jgi:hypothetical protein
MNTIWVMVIRRRMSNKAISVYAEALKREQEEKEKHPASRKPASKITPKPTRMREPSRGTLRHTSRDHSRRKSRDLPTRDEIQEFSFRLRDELKVKVQAEVPHRWQKELEEIARELNVKKLELYRFIMGEFLGKVRRKKAT